MIPSVLLRSIIRGTKFMVVSREAYLEPGLVADS